jgi:hypothetical protein
MCEDRGEKAKQALRLTAFRVALGDTGHVPHYVACLLEAVEQGALTNCGERLYQDVRFSNLDHFGGPDGGLAVLQFAVAAQPVRRSFLLGGSHSVGELERVGAIFLVPFGKSGELFTLHLPFIVLKKLNLALGDCAPFDDNLLFFPTPGRPWRWADFEELHAALQAVRVNALISAQEAEAAAATRTVQDWQRRYDQLSVSKDGKEFLATKESAQNERARLLAEQMLGFELRHVVPGALASDAVLFLRVRLRPLRHLHEVARFLVKKVDLVAVTSTVRCEEEKEDVALVDGVFLAAKNNALFDGRFVLPRAAPNIPHVAVFWQDKHSELLTKDGTVAFKGILEWYAEARCATKLWRDAGHLVLLFFVTNRRLVGSAPDFGTACDDLVIVGSEQLEQYLSPAFAGRGLVVTADEEED